MFDILIKNGIIIDGTGKPRYKNDIGIIGDTIVDIGLLDEREAVKTIDAQGLIIAPGFIDCHGHSDIVAWTSSNYDCKVQQGVTTEVIGSCGLSLAPCRDEYISTLDQYLQAIKCGEEFEWTWRSYRQFLDMLEKKEFPNNLIPLVGQGTIRVAVMGFATREPSDQELEDMRNLTREAMEAGAHGLSTGLVYPPGNYTETDEIISLCKVVGDFGGVYSTHIRNESHRVIEAVKEAIFIAEQSQASLLISHFKAMGKANWGKVNTTLGLVEEANKKGQKVWVDQYPYTANSTLMNALVPPKAMEGGVTALLERLKDPQKRKDIIHTIENIDDGTWENFVLDAGGWDGTLICSLPSHPELEGKNVSEIAKSLNKEPGDLVADLLIEQKGSGAVVTLTMSDEDVKQVMSHPAQVVGSDGLPSLGKPHPRAYGAFPRVLGKYCREEKTLTLEEGVRKMTGATAEIFNLQDRGTLVKGKKADITIFNPETIIDKATYTEPRQNPVGISWVIINGKLTIENGQIINQNQGKVLRKNN